MKTKNYAHGFSLIELLTSVTLAMLLSYSVLKVYLAQTQSYRTTNAQGLIQDTENALSQILTPMIRSTGFFGCSSIATATSNLNAGGPPPLGTFSALGTMIFGYSGSGNTYALTQSNPPNSNSASDWTPALDPSLVGQVEQGNDVLTILAPTQGLTSSGITTITNGANFFNVQNATGYSAGQFGAVSDCGKSIVFQITGVAGTAISHAAGGGTLANTSADFPITFQAGSLFIPLQQTVFFVAQSQGGNSALWMGTLDGTTGTWTTQPLVPGIEIMKVEYGIGANGSATQYVTADLVTNWSAIYSIRIGFLMAGNVGSGSGAATTYQVLGTTITVPADNRVRHVYEMTIHLRNAIS